MKFIHDLKSSLYNPDFYASLRGRTLRSSLGYFFLLVAILAFVIAFVLGSEFSPLFSTASLKKLVDYYPAELTLTIKKGVISTNVVEPYMIKTPAEFGGKDVRPHLVVIDTKSDFSRELFRAYDTDILIGKDFVANTRGSGQFQLTDTARVPDFTLSQKRLLHWADVIGSYHLALSFGLFALLLSAFFGFFTLKLLWLVVMALLVLLLGKVKRTALSYKESFQIVLHAATVPLVLIGIFIVSGGSEPFIFFYSLILLVIAFINFKEPPVGM